MNEFMEWYVKPVLVLIIFGLSFYFTLPVVIKLVI